MSVDMSQHSYEGTYQSAIARAKKVLTAAGFPWSVTTGRYHPFASTKRSTDGVKVSRVGCSETIALHVRVERWAHVADFSGHHLIEGLAIATLREAGLPFDDRGWLACGADAVRAKKRAESTSP